MEAPAGSGLYDLLYITKAESEQAEYRRARTYFFLFFGLRQSAGAVIIEKFILLTYYSTLK